MQIDLIKAKSQLDNLIRAALNGDEVVIMKDDKPILKLVRVSSSEPNSLHRKDAPAKPFRQSGSAKGLMAISDDFDEPLDDFNEYV